MTRKPLTDHINDPAVRKQVIRGGTTPVWSATSLTTDQARAAVRDRGWTCTRNGAGRWQHRKWFVRDDARRVLAVDSTPEKAVRKALTMPIKGAHS